MYRKPIRTYLRKPQAVVLSPPRYESILQSNDNSAKIFDQSTDNPFESTFDRLAKSIIIHPMPSPIPSSSSDNETSVNESAGHLSANVLEKSVETSNNKVRESLKRKKKTSVLKRTENSSYIAKKRKTDELKICRINLTRMADPEIEVPEAMSKITRRKMKKKSTGVNSELPVCFVDLTRVSLVQEDTKENDNSAVKKNKHVTKRKIRRKTINLDDSNEEAPIKPCAVELVRMDDENKSGNEKSIADNRKQKRSSGQLKNEEIELSKKSLLEGKENRSNKSLDLYISENSSLSLTKDCQVILSRVKNFKNHLTTRNMNEIASSTPFSKEISTRATIKLSPIVKMPDIEDEKSSIEEKSLNSSSLEIIESSLVKSKPLDKDPIKKMSDFLQNTENKSLTKLEFDESSEVVSDTFANTTDADSFVYQATKKPTDNLYLNKTSPLMFDSLEIEASAGISSNITESNLNSSTEIINPPENSSVSLEDSTIPLTSEQETVNDSAKLSFSETAEFSEEGTNSMDTSYRDTSENEEDYALVVSSSEDELIADPKPNLPPASVVLTRLENSVMITNHRGKYRNWKNSKTSENLPAEPSSSGSAVNEAKKNRIHFNPVVEVEMLDETNIKNNNLTEDDKQFVYLKPGKSWARSLSILNHIRNDDDIEFLSVGKGQKWRQSVKNILEMQSQGQNDVKTDRKSTRKHRSQILRSSVSGEKIESTSPGRFARRVSIRVVPNDKHSTSQDVEDLSFLEVYGIPTHRDTIAKSFLPVPSSDLDKTDEISTVSPRNVVLQRCGQVDSLPFEECYPDGFLDHCRKVGEGVYGEVFLYENESERSVIKLIPIEGKDLINGEPQKKFNEILSEIIIAKELHNLRYNNRYCTNGFVEVKNIRCVEGKYPKKLVDLWRIYDEEKTSDNDCPSIFKDGQLYISLELAHGGQDLEAFVFQNASESYTLFIQTALTLAVAEKSLEFEHRDLHWGNILISRTDELEMTYKFDDEEIIFPCKGIKVAIIDFTLSRMSYQNYCMYNDLALDPALFTAIGEYQFEIYRLMKEKTENNWERFEPYTNILWLHYILKKMISEVRYKNKTTKIHKKSIQQLEELRDIILDYNSAFDFISNSKKLSNIKRRKC